MTQYHFNILIVIMVFNSIIAVFEFFMSRGLSHPNQIILQGFNGDISWLTNTSVFYPLIGFYIDHKCNLKNINKKLLLLWIVNICSIVLSIVLTYYKYNILNFTDDDYQVFRWTFTYINTATIFITIKNIFDENYRLSPKLQKYIIILSECTFGIYLIHLWVVNYIHEFINCYNVSLCYIVSICVFMFCFLIIRLIKYIPVINKFI